MWSVKCEVWSVKFEVWSAKSAACSVRRGASREGHGRDRLSLNYRSFMFGKLPPPALPGPMLVRYTTLHHVCIVFSFAFVSGSNEGHINQSFHSRPACRDGAPYKSNQHSGQCFHVFSVAS